MEFKGTKGELKKIYTGGVCIGIGVDLGSGFYELTANSILPESYDEESDSQKQLDISEYDMTLYASSLDMLEALQWFCDRVDKGEVRSTKTYNKFKDLIKRATEI